MWNTESGTLVHRLTHRSFVKGLAWDPLGAYLASQSDDKSVSIWCAWLAGLPADLRGVQRCPGSLHILQLHF